MTGNKRLIAVLGATGHQGSAVVRALRQRGGFTIRALSRRPAEHGGIADEVQEVDLNRPETLRPALEGAYGVFAVTNAWQPGTLDETAQGTGVVEAARDAGVQHFVWSTLPNVKVVSGGKYDVPHFTNKARVDEAVARAGFRYHTFVVPGFFYQNLLEGVAPQEQPDGSMLWNLPIDPGARVIRAGDIDELGDIVAGAFADPLKAGHGEYLPLAGDLLSFNDMIETLNRQGHDYRFNKVPAEVFANFFPGAAEISEMFAFFEEYTYLPGDWADRMTLAREVAGKSPTEFATWARLHIPLRVT